jgi:hypothetical protein
MKHQIHTRIQKSLCLLLLCFTNNGAYAYSCCHPKSVRSNVRAFALCHHQSLHSQSEGEDIGGQDQSMSMDIMHRRTFVGNLVPLTAGVATTLMHTPKVLAATEKEEFSSLLSKIKEARSQLDPIPTLIKEEKWDSVRAILITPPLVDCWTKTSKPLLVKYADQIGDLPEGDELAALEYKEEALDHLRFLDMAAYNNVFNPIKSEGESGASKELIKSYYEDPKREFEVCK